MKAARKNITLVKRKSTWKPKDLLLSIIIMVLVLIIFLQRCSSFGGSSPLPDTTSVKTVIEYRTIHDTVVGKPVLISSKPQIKWRDSISIVVDSSCKNLFSRYLTLGDAYFSTNVFVDTLSLDSLGKIAIIDSVSENKITSRLFAYKLRIPEKTTTITIREPYKPVRQLYVGGGIEGNPVALINGVNAGLLYKDRKDRMYGAHVGFNGQINYGLSTYWKLSLKK
jgi:hypothetical protein